MSMQDDGMLTTTASAAAILTKFKGPNDEKPVIRPYTPVSGDGKIRGDRWQATLADDLPGNRAEGLPRLPHQALSQRPDV